MCNRYKNSIVDLPSLINRKNGKLFVDGLDLDQLIEENGTPLFIFSEQQLLRQYMYILESFKAKLGDSFELAFSIKSNPLPEIIRTFIKQNTFFEVTSLGEMKLLLKLGASAQNIIYTNIVKPKNTIKFALKAGIQKFAIDSCSDIKRIKKIAEFEKKSIQALIRINPLINLENTIFSCSGEYSKIGIPIPTKEESNSEFNEVLSICEESQLVDLIGLHMHLGSQITNIEPYRKALCRIRNLIRYLNQKNIEIKVLDIGGGFPINYGNVEVPSVSSFAEAVKKEIKEHLPSISIIAESGRFLTAPAGILAVSVVTIKKDPKNCKIACLDGNFYNTLPDIITSNWMYPILKVNQEKEESIYSYRLVGSSNDTLDQYQLNSAGVPSTISFQKLIEGDKIIFLQAGAYSLSFNCNYCLEGNPKVIFLEKK